MLIEKRGAKAAPLRVIPAKAKAALGFPEDLAIVPGTLDDLETILRGGGRAGFAGRETSG
jgi:hypothetical protein